MDALIIVKEFYIVDFYPIKIAAESPFNIKQATYKVKVVPYTFVRKGVPLRENTYPEPSACEVGWPVPFLAAFISPLLPPGTQLLLGEQ